MITNSEEIAEIIYIVSISSAEIIADLRSDIAVCEEDNNFLSSILQVYRTESAKQKLEIQALREKVGLLSEGDC